LRFCLIEGHPTTSTFSARLICTAEFEFINSEKRNYFLGIIPRKFVALLMEAEANANAGFGPLSVAPEKATSTARAPSFVEETVLGRAMTLPETQRLS
jgi:hypothetical protein